MLLKPVGTCSPVPVATRKEMYAYSVTKVAAFDHTPETGSRTTGKIEPKARFASNVTFRALFKQNNLSEGGKL
jgi:hypothetical protein